MADLDIALLKAMAVVETKVDALESSRDRVLDRLREVERQAALLEGAGLRGELLELRKGLGKNSQILSALREVGERSIDEFNTMQTLLVEKGLLSKEEASRAAVEYHTHIGDKTDVRSERDAIVAGRDQEIDRDG